MNEIEAKRIQLANDYNQSIQDTDGVGDAVLEAQCLLFDKGVEMARKEIIDKIDLCKEYLNHGMIQIEKKELKQFLEAGK